MGRNIYRNWKNGPNYHETAKNIKKIVTQNNNRGKGGQGPPSAVEPGCFKCNRFRVACPIVREGLTF